MPDARHRKLVIRSYDGIITKTEGGNVLIPILIAIHVTTVVLWIGGVAFVTVIVFPMLLRMENSLEKVIFFQGVESRFAKHARFYAWTAGITGGVILYLTGMYRALFTMDTIGITIMLIAWVFYISVLTFEKRLFKIIFIRPEKFDTTRVFQKLAAFHWFVLCLSLSAVFIGVWGGHGGHF